MLHDHPNYTIENIAWESGFAGSRNFRALFKKRYGLTPTEFLRGSR